jgi:hypothetical protein
MEVPAIGASVDASIAEPGVVGVSHLLPSSDSPLAQTGTTASSSNGNPATFNQALFVVTHVIAAARPFVSFVMRRLQRHVKETLLGKKMDIDCSGCDVFDSGPMNMRVTELVDGVFTVNTQEPEKRSNNSSRGHCFEQSQPYRAVHPIAISFTGLGAPYLGGQRPPELLNVLGVSENEKL